MRFRWLLLLLLSYLAVPAWSDVPFFDDGGGNIVVDRHYVRVKVLSLYTTPSRFWRKDYYAAVEGAFWVWDSTSSNWVQLVKVTPPSRHNSEEVHAFNQTILEPLPFRNPPLKMEITLLRVKKDEPKLLQYLSTISDVTRQIPVANLAQVGNIADIAKGGLEKIIDLQDDQEAKVTLIDELDSPKSGVYCLYQRDKAYNTPTKFEIKEEPGAQTHYALYYGGQRVGNRLTHALIHIERLNTLPSIEASVAGFRVEYDRAVDLGAAEGLPSFWRYLIDNPLILKADADKWYGKAAEQIRLRSLAAPPPPAGTGTTP